jgi:hypothetical protein
MGGPAGHSSWILERYPRPGRATRGHFSTRAGRMRARAVGKVGPIGLRLALNNGRMTRREPPTSG